MAPFFPKTLSLRERRFVDEYLIDGNAARAGRAAGYKHGSSVLQRPAIREAVQLAEDDRAARAHVRADEVILELKRLASVDPMEMLQPDGTLRPMKDIPVDLRHCIASFEVEEIWEGHGEERQQVGLLKKVKLWDKNASLDKLMRHLSLYKDKLTIEGNVTLRDLLPAVAGGLASLDGQAPEAEEPDEDEESTLDDELYGEG